MPSELKVNKLSPYTGSTLTIGDSGDTISFASGVLPSLESLTITGDLTVDTDTLFVDSTNNNVGIGTTSPTVISATGTTLDVVGDAGGFLRIERTNATNPSEGMFRALNGEIRLGAVTNSVLTFRTNNAEAMRINTSGNVGIGTTSPSTALDVDGTVTATQFVGGGLNAYKNIIINGDMNIAQRGTSFTGLGNGDGNTYTLDRFAFGEGGSSTGECTISQDTDVPTGEGFASSLKLDVTATETSVAANSLLYLMQKVESQNLQYLSYGTSSAKKLTLSFWVKSNVTTGNFAVTLYNNDATRVANLTYSISVANTWEKKTFTIDGDTVSGFDNNSGIGLYLAWNFLAGTNWTSGVGSTSWHAYTAGATGNWAAGHTANLFSSASNEWYVTGVQLEAGASASDFEFLPYDINLKRCERYYQDYTDANMYVMGRAYGTSTSGWRQVFNLKTEMRTTPTVTLSNTSNGGSATNFAVSPNTQKFLSFDLTSSNGTNLNLYYRWRMTLNSEL